MKTIAVSHEGEIATIALDRPDVLNAGNLEMLTELRSELARLETAPDVRAVIITGSGRAFCAGADLAAPRDTPAHYSDGQYVASMLDDGWNRVARELKAFPKPTVAAVNGVAAGGGIGLALACDIVLAARSAYFKQVFVPQLAVIPDVGNTWHLPRLVGPARARALMLLGDDLDAVDAAEWGLIWDVVDDGRLLEEALAIARRLAANSMPATAALKHALDRSLLNSFGEQLDLERDTNKMLGDRPGFQEGKRAFLEKRPPSFRDHE